MTDNASVAIVIVFEEPSLPPRRVVLYDGLAVEAGFIDLVVSADDLKATAEKVAVGFTKLDLKAFGMTKQRMIKTTIENLETALKKDLQAEIYLSGLKTC